MRYSLLLLGILFASCENERSVSGIVVDKITKMPLENVNVRMIVGSTYTGGIHFFKTTSALNGMFKIVSNNQEINSNKNFVELSKEGFITSMYECYQDKPNDTIFLEKNFVPRTSIRLDNTQE